MKALLRLSGVWEHLRSSLWVLPTLFVALALVLGTVLSVVRPAEGTALEPFVFSGTAEGARALLSALAGAMITVTGLTFSLTVVALQMAAGQYSPRVMRGFLADRGNQLVLSSLVSTFAYCVSVLRVIREADGEREAVLPQLAVTVGVVLSLVALGMLVYFLHHLTRQLRVESILREIAQDTTKVVDKVFPDAVDAAVPLPPIPEPGPEAVRVRAKRSGYLQAVQRGPLAEHAAERDVVVRLRPAVGAHVALGTTLAWVWRRDGTPFDEGEEEGLDRLVHDRIQLGIERTMQQDVSYGMRQLADVAVKALSPGVNDPTTAVEALGHLSVVVCHLTGRRLGSAIDVDDDGRVRLVLPRPDFRDYLHLLCDQVRRYGASEPAVLIAVLDVLADAAEQIHEPERAAAVEDQVARTLEIAEASLDATELTRVRGFADVVGTTLAEGRRPQPEVLAD